MAEETESAFKKQLSDVAMRANAKAALKLAEYAEGYTHDAKQAWIMQEDYERVVKRLPTWWKVRDVRVWLAGSCARFKATQ